MRILVTGAAGFIGSWIARALVRAGHTVLGADDFSGGLRANVQGFECLDADLSKGVQADAAASVARPDVLFHLAANAREGASQFQPAEVTRRNLMAYTNILEACIAQGFLKKVVLFSSMARYGAQKPPFGESMCPSPVDVYGVNKLACESITKILAEVHSFDWTIVVPHNVFGPAQSLRDPYRNVAAIFMNRIMRGEPLYIYGDGEQVRSFSYIEDSLPCYLRCLDEDANGEVINIGGEVPITVNELAERVIACFPEYARPEIIHLADRPCEVKHAWCTVQKSQRFGYEERVGWFAGMVRMATWAKGQGAQEWAADRLPLLNMKAPETWRGLSSRPMVAA